MKSNSHIQRNCYVFVVISSIPEIKIFNINIKIIKINLYLLQRTKYKNFTFLILLKYLGFLTIGIKFSLVKRTVAVFRKLLQ